MKKKRFQKNLVSLLEVIHLSCPIIIIVFIIIAKTNSLDLYLLKSTWETQVIMDVFLFAFTHIIFTYIILKYFRGSKRWLSSINQKKVLFQSLGIFFFTSIIIYTLNFEADKLPYFSAEIYQKLWRSLFFLFITSHFVFQNLGVSILMNHDLKDRLPIERRDKIDRLNQLEKRVFKTLFTSIFVGYVLSIFKIIRLEDTTLVIGLFIINSFLILLLYFLNKKHLGDSYKKKFIFHTRLFLYPLALLLPLLNYSRMFLHALEYAYVFTRMAPKAITSKKEILKDVYIIFSFLVTLSIFTQIPLINAKISNANNSLFKPIAFISASLYWSLTFLHYLFDRKLFQFSRSGTKKFINRIL